jgi:small subunit ribosomal protein S1
LTNSDPSNQANPTENPATAAAPADPAAQPDSAAADSTPAEPRPRILIGSQRDPAAYRPRRRDWIPVVEPEPETSGAQETTAPERAPGEGPVAKGRPARRRRDHRPKQTPSAPQAPREEIAPGKVAKVETATDLQAPAAELGESAVGPQKTAALGASVGGRDWQAKTPDQSDISLPITGELPPTGKLPPPNIREQLPPDLEEELTRALGDAAVEDMMRGGDLIGSEEPLEPESKHSGRVVAIRRGEVFVELGGREQGCLALEQLEEPPQVGTVLEVVVQRLNPDDGLYELTLPEKAIEIEDWGDLREGMLVKARVTGHNAGGLECQVNQIRGFIPLSQIALYRVEDPAQFVGQQFTCLVMEANPERRNLVLSRRAVLEREREEARQQFLNSLQPGQIHEGVVRKLVDFGAFVDIGGADGLLHVSQLAWNRVQHPSEVLAEGQKIRVKIEKVDPASGKIGLAYRDLLENPWTNAATKYPANSVVRGTVSKLMEFGAFVQLEPGVEGLVHISELSHRRVWRTSDVVHEGDEVEVLVLSVAPDAQRISLSMKALSAPPAVKKGKQEEEPAAEAPPPPPRKRKQPDQPLQGGLGRPPGGSRFGLKW